MSGRLLVASGLLIYFATGINIVGTLGESCSNIVDQVVLRPVTNDIVLEENISVLVFLDDIWISIGVGFLLKNTK